MVLKQEVLAVELVSDLGEQAELSQTSEEKLELFVQIFVCGIYVLMYILIFYLNVRKYAVNNILQQLSTRIHNTSMKIEKKKTTPDS